MKIKAVKLYDNGFMTQVLAFGGEGMDGIDPTVKYRSSLQNYVIDTGSEIILVDTGMPSEVPDAVPDEQTLIYMGSRVNSYVDALAAAGYGPEQVSKILITHKHADHTGELRLFRTRRSTLPARNARRMNCSIPMWSRSILRTAPMPTLRRAKRSPRVCISSRPKDIRPATAS